MKIVISYRFLGTESEYVKEIQLALVS